MNEETLPEKTRRVAADVAAVRRRVGDDRQAWDRVELLVDRLDLFLAAAATRLEPKLVAGFHDWLRRPIEDVRAAVISRRAAPDGSGFRIEPGSPGARVVARYWADPDYIPAILLEDQGDET